MPDQASTDLTGPGSPSAPAPPAPPRRRGRPRSAPRKDSALSTRDEILAAAASLFGSQGYTETTTRQIADAVGIKQASLYYHFADKSQILRSLLKGTVAPSVQLAEWLRTAGPDGGAPDPTAALAALARYDLDGLLRDRWNLHVVYRLLDIAETEFAETRESQVALRRHYRELCAAVLASQGVDTAALADADLELAFGLVEGIISQRQWGDDGTRAAYADAVVRGCLRLAHVPEGDVAAAVRAGEALVARFRAEVPQA
ncbi:TetR/AcrR family transcriptional regulator [Cellulomonas sp. ES6]|uniref:TetR/AcrR family transcriptional regulator n=1 Tax=Cellulomonas sp. ES6 TaxID=3039384 RepID=UPI0024B6E5AB|nr:TetR/AcrR family transcriptional regulator [Cellulomonas sp. ES6]WHP17244.1 TetR/AcrR family transcriptional regulator [Cellulomonas sp. ES6]